MKKTGEEAVSSTVRPIFGVLRTWSKDNRVNIARLLILVLCCCMTAWMILFLYCHSVLQCMVIDCFVSEELSGKGHALLFTTDGLSDFYALIAVFIVAIGFEEKDSHQRAYAFATDVAIGLSCACSMYLGFCLFGLVFAEKDYASALFQALFGLFFLTAVFVYLRNNQLASEIIKNNDDFHDKLKAKCQSLKPKRFDDLAGFLLGAACCVFETAYVLYEQGLFDEICSSPFAAAVTVFLYLMLVLSLAVNVYCFITSDCFWSHNRGEKLVARIDYVYLGLCLFGGFLLGIMFIAFGVLVVVAWVSSGDMLVMNAVFVVSVVQIPVSYVLAHFFFFRLKQLDMQSRVRAMQRVFEKAHFDMFGNSLMQTYNDDEYVDRLRETLYYSLLYVKYDAPWVSICYHKKRKRVPLLYPFFRSQRLNFVTLLT